jgi:hypothetical protein
LNGDIFGVSISDVSVYGTGIMIIIIGLLAVLAGYILARRAVGVEPPALCAPTRGE